MFDKKQLYLIYKNKLGIKIMAGVNQIIAAFHDLFTDSLKVFNYNNTTNAAVVNHQKVLDFGEIDLKLVDIINDIESVLNDKTGTNTQQNCVASQPLKPATNETMQDLYGHPSDMPLITEAAFLNLSLIEAIKVQQKGRYSEFASVNTSKT